MLSLSSTELRSHYATHHWEQPYHWYESGKGPPLVLVHGYMAHAMAYRRALGGLQDYRCILPDLPGHGYDRTYMDPRLERSVKGLGRWLNEFVASFDEPVHLVAHSMGALAALGVDDANLASLTLAAPGLRIHAPSWASHLVERLPTRLARLTGTRLAMMVYEPIQWRGEPMTLNERSSYLRPLKDPARIEFMVDVGADMLRQPNRVPLLSPRSVPTMVVWGEHDHLLKIPDAVDVKRQIGGGQLVIIPGAGHALMEDAPDFFVEVLREFIQSL